MNPLSAILKESWSLVEDRQATLAAACYARLFLSHPDMRALFPVTLDAGGSAMWYTLVSMTLAATEGEHRDHLAQLGREHRKYAARPEHYDAVGASLVEALRIVAGDRWTTEYDEAWLEAFATVERAMLTGAAAAGTAPATWTAEVVRHERRGRDIACFTCRPDQPLRYRAGQYVSVECGQHPRLWRPYSIANAPRPDGLLDFHVRARDAGWVSGALVRRLRVGDAIRLADPTGSLCVDRQSTRDIVCVAGGTGIAPIKALIEELTRFNRTRWVHLFVGARDREGLYDLPALTGLAARHPWLSVVPVCSDEPDFPGECGLVSEVMRAYGPWEQHDFFVAGPPAMMRATLRTLAGLRVPSVRINYDRPVLQPLLEIVPASRAAHRGAA